MKKASLYPLLKWKLWMMSCLWRRTKCCQTIKPVPLILRDSLLEQVEEEDEVKSTKPGSRGKRPWKQIKHTQTHTDTETHRDRQRHTHTQTSRWPVHIAVDSVVEALYVSLDLRAIFTNFVCCVSWLRVVWNMTYQMTVGETHHWTVHVQSLVK